MAHIRKRMTARGPKWDVRYRLGNGSERSETYDTREQAKAAAAKAELSRVRGGLVDPNAGSMTVAAFAEEWLRDHRRLSPDTRGFYAGQLRNHIVPYLGDIRLRDLTRRDVAVWNAELRRTGGKSVAPKAYQRLRAIMNAAVRQELIVQSPCNLQGAGVEHPAEAVVLSPEEVNRLVHAMKPRYRAALLLMTYCALRTGELLGLRRTDIDVEAGVLHVTHQLREFDDGTLSDDGPKWDSVGTIAVPGRVMAALVAHMAEFSQPEPDGLVFPGDKGGPTRRNVWEKQFRKAKLAAGLPDVTPHGLRHSGLSIAGDMGASLSQLKDLARHKTARAAIRYQHSYVDGGRRLAEALDVAVGRALSQDDEGT